MATLEELDELDALEELVLLSLAIDSGAGSIDSRTAGI
jgi:hypothetical protein